MVRVDESEIRSHVDEVVRRSVAEALNGLLEAEADQLCGAKRYDRSVDRADTRVGNYKRSLHTPACASVCRIPAKSAAVFDAASTASVKRRNWANGGSAEVMSGTPRARPGRSLRNRWIIDSAACTIVLEARSAGQIARVLPQHVVLHRIAVAVEPDPVNLAGFNVRHIGL